MPLSLFQMGVFETLFQKDKILYYHTKQIYDDMQKKFQTFVHFKIIISPMHILRLFSKNKNKLQTAYIWYESII